MTSLVTIQNSLSAGELSPGLFGRTDLAKYHSGTSTCRNFFSNYQGGVSSRAGLAYVGTCKQAGTRPPPRDIPFQFSLTQGYVLEFGDVYMRVKYNGAYVTEAAKTVTSVSNIGVFTVVGHGYSTGDWVYDVGNAGFDGLTWIVTVLSVDTFSVSSLFGTPKSSPASGAGTVSRIYTAVSPYMGEDLPYLKYTQSADVMTLTCVNTSTQTEYLPYSLTRVSNTNWVFTPDTFSSVMVAPAGLAIQAQSSDVVSTWYSYVVTAVNAAGEESNPTTPVSVQNVDIALTLGSNSLTWNQSANAVSYNVYATTPSYSATVPASSLFGFIGTSLGTAFTDTNITPDFTKVPPKHLDPFARGVVNGVTITNVGTSNYSQQTVGYSVTTGTGTGFTGTPIVTLGTVSGFIVTNPGKNYLSSDTITFTDSGGGRATGTVTFSANPADTNVVKFNGISLNFSNSITFPSTAGFVYTHIENTLALTLQTLANTLNASNLLSLSVASYTSTATTIVVTYKTPGAAGNAYTLNVGTAPCTVSGAVLTGGGTAGSGATGTLNIGSQSHTYPSVAAYFQQRRVYANSLNQPDTYWMSQPGLFSNMDSSIPVTASDSITGTPWAQQINGIQFLVPMPGGLVVLTGRGAWQVNGGASAAITPSNQTATPQAYNGCSNIVQPITINYDILYVQSKGSIFRDLSYNFFTNIYTGTDLTVLSNHLFNDYTILQAAYAEEPYKLVWAVRSDGTLLCLTYLKEQEISSWTRHDTNGLFVSVCSVTELPVDAVYVITKRYVQDGWRYYSERMDNRLWTNVEDSYCVDSGLSSPITTSTVSLQPSGTTGTITLTAASSVFSSGNVGDVIRVDGGKVVVTEYLGFGTTLAGLVTETLTETVPNDPTNKPLPSTNWSIATPVNSVSRLNHLEGLTVTALIDGSVNNPQVVTNGTITLDQPASLVVVGLPYTCQVQTMYLDAPGKDGTVQNRRKNIASVGLRVDSSRGLKIGADQVDASTQPNSAPTAWNNLVLLKERNNMVNAGTATPLYTGDYQQAITSGWNLKGQIAIQQEYPLPANILSTMAYWESGDDQ